MEQAFLKFGGTSASHPELCAAIFAGNPERNRVASPSAVGKNPMDPSDTIKGTDWLVRLGEAVELDDQSAISEAQEAFIEKNRRAYGMLDDKTLNRYANIAYKYMSPENAEDGYTWIGEHISSRMFAELTGAIYVPTGLRFKNGKLELAKSLDLIAQTISPLLRAGNQVVTEPFLAYDLDTGRVTTLERGGSDTSAVIGTGALQLCMEGNWVNENHTDKDGVFSADPDLVENAEVIAEATHEEIREKMHGVSERNGVIHGNAIGYAHRLGVDIIVKNTFNPSAPGTKIVSKRNADPQKPIIGVSGKSKITAIDVFDMGMADAVNYTAPILAKVGDEGLSISNYPTGEDRLKLVINSSASDRKLGVICDFIRDRTISGELAEIEVLKNDGAVYLIGQELTKPEVYTKTLCRTAAIMDAAGLSIRSIISHEKSPSLMMTVAGDEVNDVIKLLHAELIEAPKS